MEKSCSIDYVYVVAMAFTVCTLNTHILNESDPNRNNTANPLSVVVYQNLNF